MIKACVVGWPISHSRSPMIHNYWLKLHGLAGSYERVAVPPDGLARFLLSLDSHGFRGCNLTIPHKERALGLVDSTDEISRRIGSINTVWCESGKLCAMSTDGMAFCANIVHSIPDFSFKDKFAVVLGAGGSSRAVVDGLLLKGAGEIIVANRTFERAIEVAKLFGAKVKAVELSSIAEVLGNTNLLVNTTSISLTDSAEIPVDLARLPPDAVVCDIVYVPLETRLLKRARQRGLKTVGGLGMLLHQAVPGFEKWFGVRPVVTRQLFDLVAADIQKGP
jgi:shikimate dehydrogenase